MAPTYGYSGDAGRPSILFRRKNFRVHLLVCEAFNGPKPFPEAVAMHLDEDNTNNLPGNLRWGTQKENLNMPKIKAYHRAACRQKMTGVAAQA